MQSADATDAVVSIPSQPQADGWEGAISRTLAKWRQSPEDLADEGCDAPTRELLDRAIQLARRMSAAGLPPPRAIVPTVNGGVTFSIESGSCSESLVLEDDQLDYYLLEHDRVIEQMGRSSMGG